MVTDFQWGFFYTLRKRSTNYNSPINMHTSRRYLHEDVNYDFYDHSSWHYDLEEKLGIIVYVFFQPQYFFQNQRVLLLFWPTSIFCEAYLCSRSLTTTELASFRRSDSGLRAKKSPWTGYRTEYAKIYVYDVTPKHLNCNYVSS